MKTTKILGLMICLLAPASWPVVAQQIAQTNTPPLEASPAPPRPAYASPSVISRLAEVPDLSNETPFQWGKFSLRPHLLYRSIYGDGIQSAPGREEETFIQEISPGILLELGSHWTLDYTPTFSFYSNSRFRDTVGHNVNLDGHVSYEDWEFGLNQSYVATSEPLIETATQTEQEIHATALSASHHFTDDLWIDLGLNQTFRFADSAHNFPTNVVPNFTDSREWSTMDWLNYRIFAGLDAGIGAGFGYVDMDSGLDMTYEMIQARARWRATDKIFLNAGAGISYRQFLRSSADDMADPIYSASIEYHPFEQTTVSVSGNRRITTSYFQNQITETTDVQISLNQRLLERLNCNFAYGYNHTRFVSSSSVVVPNRRDETTFFSVRITCPIRQRITLGAFYNRSENSSSQSNFEYSSSQVGLDARYQF